MADSDKTFAYAIRVDGFTLLAQEAKAATAEIQGVEKELRKLATGGGAAPFNAVDAARAKAAANADRIAQIKAGFGDGAGTASAGGLSAPDSSLDRLGTATGNLQKYETAATSAALAGKNAGAGAQALGAGASAAAAGLSIAAVALGDWITTGIGSAVEKQGAIAGLNGALTSLSGTSKVTAADVASLAEELQGLTGRDSATFIDIATNLLERNVPQDGLLAATKLTADLIGVTGNAEKATQLLSQTLAGSNGPLNRYGAGLTEASTQAERFEALQKLATQGAAQNAARLETAGGQWGLFKGKIADTSESAGRQVLSLVEGPLKALNEALGATPEKGAGAADSIAELAAAAEDAAPKIDTAAQAAADFANITAEVLQRAQGNAASLRRADRAARRAEDAEEIAREQAKAEQLLQIAKREAEGLIDANGAERMRSQVNATAAVEAATAATKAAEEEARRAAESEADLAKRVDEAQRAFNRLEGAAKDAAGAQLRAANEALRVATEKREDAEDAADKARGRQQLAEIAKENARTQQAITAREQAEKDEQDAKDRADKERERADKERARNIKALGDAIAKAEEEQKRQQEQEQRDKEQERRKQRPDGRKKIGGLTPEESAEKDKERQAPDRTLGSDIFERNKQRSKEAAESAKKAEEATAAIAEGTAATDAILSLMTGNFSGMVSAMETLKKAHEELQRRVQSLRS